MALPLISIFAGSEVGCPQLELLDAQLPPCEAQLLLKIFGSMQETAMPFP
jgi:hypothetical protein